MHLGEKRWSIIQIKTNITKVNAAPLLYVKLTSVQYICPDILSILFLSEFAEAKFKEVMDSYEAIKLERQNGSL